MRFGFWVFMLLVAAMVAASAAGSVQQSMAPKQITIVALGDSTTAGTPGFLSPVEAAPDGKGDETSQFAYWMMKARPAWRVLNRGVNGERADQIRRRFEKDVQAHRPAVVIVIAGVNDIYQGWPAKYVRDDLRAIYERARDAGITVVAGSIIPYNTATPDQNERMRAVNAWIREVASRDSNMVFCDTRAAVARPDNPDKLRSSPDELHPSPEGYRAMADALVPCVETALSRRTGAGG
jgi:lysophospholipase L1-like esterase